MLLPVLALAETGPSDNWVTEGGSITANQAGIYGTLGQPAFGNVPGARSEAVTVTDKSGNLWLFGGDGYDSAGISGNLGDLWKFNTATGQWTWVSGSNVTDHTQGAIPGVYGTKGVAAPANNPGTRDAAVGWADSAGNLWIFGGYGLDTNGKWGLYDDLWEFNTATNLWTWVSGSNTIGDQGGLSGVYGTGADYPGSRVWAQTWTDPSGNFWLFGGYGADGVGNGGFLNDLWEFNTFTKHWVWVSGSKQANQPGVYGTLRQPETGNVPGGRSQAVSFIDLSGNLWLFGGEGYDSAGISGNLGDLWKFDTVNLVWTWISGSDVTDHTLGALPGTYGTQGVAASANNPGTRDAAIGWTDSNGNFWLFGGYGIDPPGTWGFYNDLWEFDPTIDQWTWVSGDNTMSSFGGHAGVYGGGTGAPGSRIWAGSWTDNNGHIWLFGGYGFDSLGNGSGGLLNDLWKD
jgi:N-acetylneuraminic acid mutarotase